MMNNSCEFVRSGLGGLSQASPIRSAIHGDH